MAQGLTLTNPCSLYVPPSLLGPPNDIDPLNQLQETMVVVGLCGGECLPWLLPSLDTSSQGNFFRWGFERGGGEQEGKRFYLAPSLRENRESNNYNLVPSCLLAATGIDFHFGTIDFCFWFHLVSGFWTDHLGCTSEHYHPKVMGLRKELWC